MDSSKRISVVRLGRNVRIKNEDVKKWMVEDTIIIELFILVYQI